MLDDPRTDLRVQLVQWVQAVIDWCNRFGSRRRCRFFGSGRWRQSKARFPSLWYARAGSCCRLDERARVGRQRWCSWCPTDGLLGPIARRWIGNLPLVTKLRKARAIEPEVGPDPIEWVLPYQRIDFFA
jgi:hypothetical protein